MFCDIQKLCKTIHYPLKRWYSSALYITGNKAQKNFAALTPVVDFESQMERKVDLLKNITARGLNIDLEKLEQHWNFFRSIEHRKKVLERTKSEIGHLILDLMKNPEENKEDIEKLKVHVKVVKNDLKHVKTHYYGVEEDTMLKILNLPNLLHGKTPLDTELIIYNYLDPVHNKSASHFTIADTKGLLKFMDANTCYLKCDAALFEIGILNYFRTCLINLGYSQFSNPNFCKSVIVEGCGENASNVFTIEKHHELSDHINKLHFCGSSTLFSFMAYFSRHFVQKHNFPLKYFSLGKIYQPSSHISTKSLFHLNQQSVINMFIATLKETNDAFEVLTKQIGTFYEELGYHFRLSLLPARELLKSESLRVSIQLYSNYLEKYVEVGNISLYDNYLSKRLLFTYNDKKQRKFPQVTAGTLVNMPKLLGCVLENNSFDDKSLLTDTVKKYLFL